MGPGSPHLAQQPGLGGSTEDNGVAFRSPRPYPRPSAFTAHKNMATHCVDLHFSHGLCSNGRFCTVVGLLGTPQEGLNKTSYLLRSCRPCSSWGPVGSSLGSSCFSLVIVVSDAVQRNTCLRNVGVTTEQRSNSMSVSSFSHACFQWMGVYHATAWQKRFVNDKRHCRDTCFNATDYCSRTYLPILCVFEVYCAVF